MRIIRLADGTEHEISFCGAASDYLQIHLIDTDSIAQTAVEFSNPEKTAKIVSTYDKPTRYDGEYIGYTELTQVRKARDYIDIWLRKE